MGFSNLFGTLFTWVIFIGLPVVQCYHQLCENIFLNVADKNARGLEKMANQLLAPAHYLFCGQAAQKSDLGYELTPRFDYREHFLLKTALSTTLLPLSVISGAALKAAAYLCPEVRRRHQAMVAEQESCIVRPNLDLYHSLGFKMQDFESAPFIPPPTHTRRPGDDAHMQVEKEGLKAVVELLRESKIPFWVDCGSCLGAVRYGGIIPWDWDLDIAVLQPDFENVKRALNALDKSKYTVQDWSGREKPGSYLKVYVKGTPTLIDIYHFEIDPEDHIVKSIFSNEYSPFFPESMKIRERRYTVATPFDLIFPLKKAHFDGIEVLVPGRTVEYLQQRYGENIGPAKVYDPITGCYEKDLTHPYWQMEYAR